MRQNNVIAKKSLLTVNGSKNVITLYLGITSQSTSTNGHDKTVNMKVNWGHYNDAYNWPLPLAKMILKQLVLNKQDDNNQYFIVQSNYK